LKGRHLTLRFLQVVQARGLWCFGLAAEARGRAGRFMYTSS
jgi:hypothetical protein